MSGLGSVTKFKFQNTLFFFFDVMLNKRTSTADLVLPQDLFPCSFEMRNVGVCH